MKFLRKTILALLSLIIIVTTVIYIYLHSLKPQYSGELKLAGLKEEADVFFDEFGIPHIYAKNEEMLFLHSAMCMHRTDCSRWKCCAG